MSHLERIQKLWSQNDGNLTDITRELIHLIGKAHEQGQSIPIEMELDIVLQANYAIGYGSKPKEISAISELMLKLLKASEGLSSHKIHRLGCTLASALISHMTSSQHLEEAVVSGLVPWSTDDSDPTAILTHLVSYLIKLLEVGHPNEWSLELITFICTLILILADLDDPYTLTSEATIVIQNSLKTLKSTKIYDTWQESWLEKSDYYRFVTLMMSNTSRDEEVWIKYVEAFLSL